MQLHFIHVKGTAWEYGWYADCPHDPLDYELVADPDLALHTTVKDAQQKMRFIHGNYVALGHMSIVRLAEARATKQQWDADQAIAGLVALEKD